MGSPRRAEDLAGEAVLQLDYLALDDHLLGARWRPVCAWRVGVGHLCVCEKGEGGGGDRKHKMKRLSCNLYFSRHL